MKSIFALLFVAVFCIAPTHAPANAAPPASRPAQQAVELQMQPAAIPDPALKYRLLPKMSDRTAGDAAPLYLMTFLQARLTEDEQKQLAELLKAPRDSFNLDAAKKILASRDSYFASLELAARRDRCHWDIPLREQGFSALLPYLTPARDAARLLALRARVQTMEGKFDPAVRTLQSGFALVEHLKDQAVLIQGLVAVGIANLLLDRLAELQQTPGAPNLYWALAELPRPVADMRAETELEGAWVMYMAPELRGRQIRDLSSEEMKAIITRIRKMSESINGEGPGVGGQLALALVIAQATPAARAWLTSHGYTEKQVQEMPGERAVGIYFFESYQRVSDDLNKWMSLPYWQARHGLPTAETELRQASQLGNNPLMMLLPATAKAYERVVMTDQRIAMLQTTDALRAYAAGHGGKLPASLADLTEAPAPADPVTCKPFGYEAQGDACVLTGGATEHGQAVVYRVR